MRKWAYFLILAIASVTIGRIWWNLGHIDPADQRFIGWAFGFLAGYLLARMSTP